MISCNKSLDLNFLPDLVFILVEMFYNKFTSKLKAEKIDQVYGAAETSHLMNNKSDRTFYIIELAVFLLAFF